MYYAVNSVLGLFRIFSIMLFVRLRTEDREQGKPTKNKRATLAQIERSPEWATPLRAFVIEESSTDPGVKELKTRISTDERGR